MKKAALLFGLMALPGFAHAEYRAYQYMVKTNDPFAVATQSEAQYLVSTLSPQMYKTYHGGSYVKIDLLRTWICPGYTGKGQKICDHPYDKENPIQ